MADVINMTPKVSNKKAKRIAVIVLIILVAAAIISSAVCIVPAGHKGVLMNMGAVSEKVLSEGVNIKIPFFQSVEIMDVRVLKFESEGNASASRDLQQVTSSIAVNYRIDSSSVGELYKNIGPNYQSTVISPAISECVKAVTSRYTAEELITKRSEVSEQMKTMLEDKLSNKYILIDSFNVTDFQFSDAFNKAIEEKQIAEQEALKAQYDLERIKTEAEQTVKKAEGEAEAMKVKNDQITDNIIMLEFINKWDGKMPTYYGGDGNLFLDMTSKAAQSDR